MPGLQGEGGHQTGLPPGAAADLHVDGLVAPAVGGIDQVFVPTAVDPEDLELFTL